LSWFAGAVLHIVDALLALGARAADAGEFTLRALSNQRLNLSQAEAVRDLIDAQTQAAVRQAARQLGGESPRASTQPRCAARNNRSARILARICEDDLPQLLL
jgi:tRNA U34 5-carboxymethylaminomethyl modifying GTPase MnmE/TrmE